MPPSLSGPPRADASASRPAAQYLIFMVTGNPGLIDYYGPFLSTLQHLLEGTKRDRDAAFHVAGHNLIGFDDADHEPFTSNRPPFGLQAQIDAVMSNMASMRIEQGPRKGQAFDQILLIGHSVGSYIVLEVFHRVMHNPELYGAHVNLRAGILLFPTVTEMAKSPRGRVLNGLRTTPGLNMAPRVAQSFLSLLPSWMLHWIVRRIMRFPPAAADVTTSFLASRDGVWQALHLGFDEMRLIGEETWAEELWEISEDAAAHHHDAPKFYFFFGNGDHWVAEDCRRQFIKKREEHATREGPKHKRGRTRIVIDEGRLPHDFCISKLGTVKSHITNVLNTLLMRMPTLQDIVRKLRRR